MTKEETTALEELKFRACQLALIAEWKETKADSPAIDLVEKMHEEQLQRLQWAATAYFSTVTSKVPATQSPDTSF